MARWVLARDEAEEEASSSEEEDDVEEEASEEEPEQGEAAEEQAGPERGGGRGAAAAAPSPGTTIAQRKLSIKLGGPDICHVSEPRAMEGMAAPPCGAETIERARAAGAANRRCMNRRCVLPPPAGVRPARAHRGLRRRQVHRL